MNRNIALFYFSGTGNTRLVAAAAQKEFLHKGYSCRLVEINSGTDTKDLKDDEVLGIAYPVYGLGLPGIVERFLKGLPSVKKGDSFIIANAHSNSGLSISKAEKILQGKGFSVSGAVSTYTPSSSIITEETEPDDIAGEMRASAVEKTVEFVGSLINDRIVKETGSVTVRERLVSVLFKTVMPAPVVKKAYATDSCSGCGKCAADCPVQNIVINDGKPSWGRSCEVCMRCINLCPNNAIEMMGSEGRARYKGGLI